MADVQTYKMGATLVQLNIGS